MQLRKQKYRVKYTATLKEEKRIMQLRKEKKK